MWDLCHSFLFFFFYIVLRCWLISVLYAVLSKIIGKDKTPKKHNVFPSSLHKPYENLVIKLEKENTIYNIVQLCEGK